MAALQKKLLALRYDLPGNQFIVVGMPVYPGAFGPIPGLANAIGLGLADQKKDPRCGI